MFKNPLIKIKQKLLVLLGILMLGIPFAASTADTTATRATTESIVLGMGCFWGAEKRMSEIPGVVHVEVGYAGGDAPKVGYNDILNEERASRRGANTARNHAEVVKVSFDPARVDLKTILIKFWENHDPTQGDRQGNDVGSNYRSAIYYTTEDQKAVALSTRDAYQAALTKAGHPSITTEIAPLRNYNTAEEYHQNYLKKNPNGYCGLGGTSVAYPQLGTSKNPKDGVFRGTQSGQATHPQPPQLSANTLNFTRQLIVFEAEDCPFCKQFKADVLNGWRSEVPIITTLNPHPPEGWTLSKALFATPTIVLFEQGKEISRYTGYNGEKDRFWKWLGYQLLTPEQRRIAFEDGTERPFTGSHLDEKRPGMFVDPITGAPLFRSDAKFDSGTGWPSFFNPVPGAITLKEDNAYGMHRVEVISTSSGIHLGHVFDDGPPPTGKRYCINGNVLKFVPDKQSS